MLIKYYCLWIWRVILYRNRSGRKKGSFIYSKYQCTACRLCFISGVRVQESRCRFYYWPCCRDFACMDQFSDHGAHDPENGGERTKRSSDGNETFTGAENVLHTWYRIAVPFCFFSEPGRADSSSLFSPDRDRTPACFRKDNGRPAD